MSAADVIHRPGLAYIHAFDWLSVRFQAADTAACWAGSDWQLLEVARRLPHISFPATKPAVRAAVAASLGLAAIAGDAAELLQAEALIEPATLPLAAVERLAPGGRLYVVAAGRAARFLAERRADDRPVLSEKDVLVAARAAGLRVVERLGIHSPSAMLDYYAGQAALALGRRDWRDRCHFAMRRDFVTNGAAAGWSALVCLALERAT